MTGDTVARLGAGSACVFFIWLSGVTADNALPGFAAACCAAYLAWHMTRETALEDGAAAERLRMADRDYRERALPLSPEFHDGGPDQ